jgi:hypothetical protein
MTPVVMADRVTMPALASPGALAPNGGSGQDQAGIVLASGPEPTNGFVVAQASPAGAAQPTSTVDSPAVVVESASRSNRNGQGSGMGERVLKYMNALHDNGRRVTERATARAPAVAEPAVKLVVAVEPGPAAAALAPAEQQGFKQATDDRFEANLQALQQLYDYTITVNLVANTVNTATGAVKQLTERMG